MAEVLMYSTRLCPYCMRARMLLEAKGVDYREIRVDERPAERETMRKLSGRTSVPQIWINGRHVGGFTELWALESRDELGDWLAQDAAENPK